MRAAAAAYGRGATLSSKNRESPPAQRVVHLLNYFNTCRAFRDNHAYAHGVLRQINEIGERKSDERLLQYARYLGEARKWDSTPEAQQVMPIFP